MPVSETQEKTQQVVNTHVQHVVNTVKVDKPKIIKQTLQKPVIQEKINKATKRVEVPQFLNEVVYTPVIMQRQAPLIQTVQTGQFFDIPVVAQRQAHLNRNDQETIEVPQFQFSDKVSDILAVLVV